ncbi:MAG: hypothetical protein O8C63_07295, partial [Candidatus Methanoperedens sp.]|nr:hypothetical protein [Candidatus Methanoperedens sp.]
GERRAVAAPMLAWPTITPVQVVSGLSRPTYVTHAGDNSGRLFVVEQSGRIWIRFAQMRHGLLVKSGM